MKATAAISGLLKNDPQWRQFFKQSCKYGALRLRSQAWQWRDELAEVSREGQRFSLEEVEDALLVIARKVVPESPAAAWDPEWAEILCKDALARLGEHNAGLSAGEREALDLSAQDEWHERMEKAGEANDPATFRAALKGWEKVGLQALERALAKRGAA